MNAIELLMKDHEEVENLFDRFEEVRTRELFDRICQELEIHTQIEEEIFYPAINQIDSDLVIESLADHDIVKQLINELRGLNLGSDEFNSKCEELRASVEDHVAVEETELFPEVEASLETDLDALGNEMSRRKEVLKAGKATRSASA